MSKYKKTSIRNEASSDFQDQRTQVEYSMTFVIYLFSKVNKCLYDT